jgi:hypothetical protein
VLFGSTRGSVNSIGRAASALNSHPKLANARDPCLAPAFGDARCGGGLPERSVQGGAVSGDTLLVSITLENTTTGDYQLLLIAASVMDDKGHTFELSGEPRGIHADVRDSCAAVGSIISAGARQVISIPFKAPQGTSVADGTFALALELQTPDRSQMFGCRTFAVSLDGIRP